VKIKLAALVMVAVFAALAWHTAGASTAHRIAGWTWGLDVATGPDAAGTLVKPSGWKLN
jgi:hypothetical protein